MNNVADRKMNILKKVFIILLILDIVALLLSGIALLPTFSMMVEYGIIMVIVMSTLTAIMSAVLIFEIIAKIFIIRSASPAFSWERRPKGYTAFAKLLLVFNILAIIIGLLSAGGEGATVINQTNTYLRILASLAEIVAAVFYLRAVKKISVND